MKRLFFLFYIFINLSAQDSYIPISNFLIVRSGYCLSYDGKNKNPEWVYECLTEKNVYGDAKRENCQFKEDEDLPDFLRTTIFDYKLSGFDRGHLAPAANHKYDDTAMADTFFLSNVCPQDPSLNRGIWSRLEKHARSLTKTNEKVHVISGPLYLPNLEENGKRYVKYEVIGLNNVAVPTHFYKIIILENEKVKDIEAYIIPNDKCNKDKNELSDFSTTIENIQKLAGFILKNNKSFSS